MALGGARGLPDLGAEAAASWLLGLTGQGCVLDHHPTGEGRLWLHHLL